MTSRFLVAILAGFLALFGLQGLSGSEAPDASEAPRPISQAEAGRPLNDDEIEQLLELHHTEQEEVRLVLLPAVVTTPRGKVIQGLEEGDFSIFEDYVPQEIRYFGTEQVTSVDIAFLLDLSGSMRQVGKLDEAKEAIRVFVDALDDQDRFGLICFADNQVTWVTDFTTDEESFLKRLSVQEAYGQTALFDALASTPTLVDEQNGTRKAIVLFTDGIDNASRMNTFKAMTLARRVNVPIYIVSFRTFASRELDKQGMIKRHLVLNRFADETGGTLFPVYDPVDLKEAVLTIQDELRFQYLIGYHPGGRNWDGSFRRVKLETSRKKAHVRTRRGYYAEP